MRALIFAGVVTIAAACGSTRATDPGHVTREQFGTRWPLTLLEGTLRCEPGRVIVIRATDGRDFGVNGMAAKYPDIAPVWADDPAIPGLKMDIGPLIDAGLKLC